MAQEQKQRRVKLMRGFVDVPESCLRGYTLYGEMPENTGLSGAYAVCETKQQQQEQKRHPCEGKTWFLLTPRLLRVNAKVPSSVVFTDLVAEESDEIEAVDPKAWETSLELLRLASQTGAGLPLVDAWVCDQGVRFPFADRDDAAAGYALGFAVTRLPTMTLDAWGATTSEFPNAEEWTSQLEDMADQQLALLQQADLAHGALDDPVSWVVVTKGDVKVPSTYYEPVAIYMWGFDTRNGATATATASDFEKDAVALASLFATEEEEGEEEERTEEDTEPEGLTTMDITGPSS